MPTFVFTATGWVAQFLHIRSLHQLTGLPEHFDVQANPAFGDLSSECVLSIVLQSFNGEPLQRRPAVWSIPLLLCLLEGGHHAAGLQEFISQNSHDALYAFFRRQFKE